jgi:hypothetical protein
MYFRTTRGSVLDSSGRREHWLLARYLIHTHTHTHVSVCNIIVPEVRMRHWDRRWFLRRGGWWRVFRLSALQERGGQGGFGGVGGGGEKAGGGEEGRARGREGERGRERGGERERGRHRGRVRERERDEGTQGGKEGGREGGSKRV